MYCVVTTAAPLAKVVVYTMLVVTSSVAAGRRVVPVVAVRDARLKLDVVFGKGGRKNEEKLGNMLVLRSVLEGEVKVEGESLELELELEEVGVEVEAGLEDGDVSIGVEVPEDELKP